MTDQPKAPDPLDAAIAAAESQVEMIQVQVTLATGRPAIIAMPKDATDLEILSLVGQALMLGDKLRAMRPSSRLVLPNGARPV